MRVALTAALAFLALAIAADAAGAPASACLNTIAAAGGLTGGAAAGSLLDDVTGLALDGEGRLLAGTTASIVVRQADGSAVRLAGGGDALPPADGFPINALSLKLNKVRGLAYDSVLNVVYFTSNLDHWIGALSLDSGEVARLAGTGRSAFEGDGVPALSAAFKEPWGLALNETARVLFVADAGANCVRAINLITKTVTTLAGVSGSWGSGGDGGPAREAKLAYPTGLVAHAGHLYIAEYGNSDIRVIYPNSTVGVLTGGQYDWVDGANPSYKSPQGISMDAAGKRMFIADTESSTVRYYDFVSGNATTIAGSAFAGWMGGYSGDGGAPLAALFSQPLGILYDPATANVYVADSNNDAVRVIKPGFGLIDAVMPPRLVSQAANATASTTQAAQVYTVTKSLGLDISMRLPEGVTVDCATDDLYFSDYRQKVIHRVDRDGVASVLAGTKGTPGTSGNGGPAGLALLRGPDMIRVHHRRRMLLFMDNGMRYVNLTSGTIHAFLPRGAAGGGDGGPVSAATAVVGGFAIDEANDVVYVADDETYLRAVDLKTWNITTIYAGDGMTDITRVAYYAPGDAFYLAAAGDIVLRKLVVDRENASLSTYEDIVNSINGPAYGSAATGRPAAELGLYGSADVLVMGHHLYLLDDGRQVIYDINLADANLTVTAVAGNVVAQAAAYNAPFVGDGGHPSKSYLQSPRYVNDDCHGGIVFTDMDNIRQITNLRPEATAGSVQPCPAGFTCPCGRKPLPCAAPAAYCPRDSAAPVNASAGYYARVVPPSQSLATTPVFVSQSVCPRGFACFGGLRHPCPAGTYGLFTNGYSIEAACIPCAAGTYASRLGLYMAPEAAEPPCSACPAGYFTEAAGASACSPCPPNTYSTAVRGASRSSCRPCPPSTWSLSGSTACRPLLASDIAVVEDDFSASNFQQLVAYDAGNDSWFGKALPGMILLIVLAVLPGLALCSTSMCSASARATTANVLTKLDTTSLAHPIVEVGGSPKKTPTAYGGSLTVFFIGVVGALSIAQLVQYLHANTVVVQSLLPITFAELPSVVATKPPFVAGRPATAVPIVSGFALRIDAIGAPCSDVSRPALDLKRGNLSYSRAYNATDGTVAHTFFCEDCLLSARSSLTFSVNGACSSFVASAATVGAWGNQQLSSLLVTNASTVDISFPMKLEVVEDAMAAEGAPSRSYFGWSGLPGALTARAATAASTKLVPDDNGLLSLAALTTPSSFVFTVQFPLEPTYVKVRLTPAATTVQLLSSIAGLLSLLGLAKLMLSVSMKVRAKLEERKKKTLTASHNGSNIKQPPRLHVEIANPVAGAKIGKV